MPALDDVVMLEGEPLSPELVLVCPELAERARALLPTPVLDPELRAVGDQVGSEHAKARVTSEQGMLTERLERLLEDLELTVVDLRREARHESQRLDEVAALVGEFATSWRRLDRRLALLEQSIASMGEPGFQVPAPVSPEGLELEPSTQGLRAAHRRAPLGLAGALLFVVSIVVAMITLELLPPFQARPHLTIEAGRAVPPTRSPDPAPSGGGTTTTAAPEAPLGGGAPGTAVTQPSRSAPRARQPSAEPPESLPRAPTAPPPRTAPARSKGGAGVGTRAAPSTPPVESPSKSGFKPARVFFWPAVEGARAYAVTFLRDGSTFYTARVSEPRIVLPKTLQFRPGSYRWIVQPVAQPPAEGLAGAIVDSTFTIE